MTVLSARRLAAAQQAVSAAGLDAALLTPGPDLLYLTGFDAPALERLTCLIVPATGTPSLVVPQVEVQAVADVLAESSVELVPYQEGDDAYGMVGSLVGSADVIALDGRMPVVTAFALRDAMPAVAWRAAGHVLSRLRLRKSEEELAALKKAAVALDEVQVEVAGLVSVGRSERAIVGDIRVAMFRAGFDTIECVSVASGRNGASPHHIASDRVVRPGDAVTVDLAGRMPSGYWADTTRVFVAGEPSPEFAELYSVVREAQQAACDAVRPGVSFCDVDRAARRVISAAGFDAYFVHRTGHGVGLAVHEGPFIGPRDEGELLPGMVFSVEPGIYVPERHGARLEDVVVCTSTGVERLNRSPRGLVEAASDR